MNMLPPMGERMLRTAEPGQETYEQEKAIRALTGGKPLEARALAGDFVEVKPQFKATFVSYRSGLKITTTMESFNEDRPGGEADN